MMEENFEAGALTKAELVDLLFEQMGMNKREAKMVVDGFFDLICQKPKRVTSMNAGACLLEHDWRLDCRLCSQN